MVHLYFDKRLIAHHSATWLYDHLGCGSRIICDWQIGRVVIIASRLAPTFDRCVHKFQVNPETLVGASLLAIAVVQAA
jgi:hypothetical protein